MSRTQKTIRLTCDLCCHAVDVPYPKIDQGPFIVPDGWGTGAWFRQNGGDRQSLLISSGVNPDFCPDCIDAVSEVIDKRRRVR